ncbi:DUF3575 domain-containing protein [Bacteroides sp.]|uniref:DUF3575 domain-containing protein n=1 Tax=Bacteroides sp. TaxID=29523 RepID=UPI00262FC5AC|nr:DUF3575 domain-containing protein [Bacteroides sp.]MDD3038677.1 DUF3575 domain-containing protein [Bacteroides sp.]
MKFLSNILLFSLVLGCYTGECYGQADTVSRYVLYFQFDKNVLDSQYMNNSTWLQEFDRIFNDRNIASKIDSVVITASVSPEGAVRYNQELSSRRAKAVEQYLVCKYPYTKQYKILLNSIGEDWAGLQQLVEEDANAPYKEQILKTITSDVDPVIKECQLRQIEGGRVWSYITKHYLRHLRVARTCIVFSPKKGIEKCIEQPFEECVELPIDKVVPEQEITEQRTTAVVEQPIETQVETLTKPLFAFKTNLLFDALLLPNIEVEVPIGNRWSVAGEWIFPWWLSKDNSRALQVQSGNIEGRYWLGRRTNRKQLTGHFVGLYGGGGYYDLENKSSGYQGEFYIAAGVSYGYGLRLSKHFNMEFSIGIGYLHTKYRHYHGEQNNTVLMWQNDGRYTWVGPTKAKVSLVWLIGNKTGGRR